MITITTVLLAFVVSSLEREFSVLNVNNSDTDNSDSDTSTSSTSIII